VFVLLEIIMQRSVLSEETCDPGGNPGVVNSKALGPSFVPPFAQVGSSCCGLSALFLSVVVTEKFGAAGFDFWYFGFIGQSFFGVSQCVFSCVAFPVPVRGTLVVLPGCRCSRSSAAQRHQPRQQV